MPADVADLDAHPRELRAYAGRDDVDFSVSMRRLLSGVAFVDVGRPKPV